MPWQYEKKPPSREDLSEACGVDFSQARMSGGRIMNFQEGWALEIFSDSEKGHYYRVADQVPEVAVSLCGRKHHAQTMNGLGDYQRCKHCEKRLKLLEAAKAAGTLCQECWIDWGTMNCVAPTLHQR